MQFFIAFSRHKWLFNGRKYFIPIDIIMILSYDDSGKSAYIKNADLWNHRWYIVFANVRTPSDAGNINSYLQVKFTA